MVTVCAQSEPKTYRQAIRFSRRECRSTIKRAKAKGMNTHKFKELMDATAEAVIELLAKRGLRSPGGTGA